VPLQRFPDLAEHCRIIDRRRHGSLIAIGNRFDGAM
jgi:hypothetical protein